LAKMIHLCLQHVIAHHASRASAMNTALAKMSIMRFLLFLPPLPHVPGLAYRAALALPLRLEWMPLCAYFRAKPIHLFSIGNLPFDCQVGYCVHVFIVQFSKSRQLWRLRATRH
jgi:hypothetical protein